jgi:hypothetical protein
LYARGNYKRDQFNVEDKVKLPVFIYFLGLICTFIPVLGILFSAVFLITIIVGLAEKSLYYKRGKISKFFLKEI